MPATKKPAPKAKQEIIGTRVKITLDDSRGKETLTLKTPAGQKITLSDARGTIEIADGNGNTVRLEPSGITIQTAAKVTINAAELKVRASAVVVDAAMSKFNGTVQCDTLISNAVISASYTPGAGNIL